MWSLNPGRFSLTWYHRSMKGLQGLRMEVPTQKVVAAASAARRASWMAHWE